MLNRHIFNFKNFLILTRLHRPVGIILLALPCFWGLAFIRAEIFDYLLFLIGSILLRSAGCVFNDIIDKDLDKKVFRTKKRPLASNSLTVKQAYAIFLILALFGLIIFFYLSTISKIISLVGFIFLLIYPFFKRWTYFPQIFLGLTFNMGVLISASHVLNYEDLLDKKTPIILLYLSGIFWTIAYDTIYALQDYHDDIKAGVKSIPVYFKKNTKYVIFFAYILMGLILFIFWIKNKTILSTLFFLLVLLILFYKIFTIDYLSEKTNNFDDIFKYNQLIGIWIWLSII